MPDPPRPQPPRSPVVAARAWVAWFGATRLLVTVGATVAVAVGLVLLLRPSGPPVEASLPVVAPSEGRSGQARDTASTTSATVVIHVAGAVARPGVVRVAADLRVIDALAAAGGAVGDADLDALNLAAPLADGSRIYVPRVGEPVPVAIGPEGPSLVAGPVDLNSAGVELLDALPGIGPTTAAAIVTYRDEHGPFGSVDQLGDVPGIGPAKLEALRGLVSV